MCQIGKCSLLIAHFIKRLIHVSKGKIQLCLAISADGSVESCHETIFY